MMNKHDTDVILTAKLKYFRSRVYMAFRMSNVARSGFLCGNINWALKFLIKNAFQLRNLNKIQKFILQIAENLILLNQCNEIQIDKCQIFSKNFLKIFHFWLNRNQLNPVSISSAAEFPNYNR